MNFPLTPHTNLHELNLDWIISNVEYIKHYFDNLDTQEEIDNKIDEMIADGTFAQIVAPFIQIPPKFVSSTSDMTDHDTPYVLTGTGYIYAWNGTTFANTGLQYDFNGATYYDNLGALASGTSVDTLHTNSAYLISGNASGLPSGASAYGTLYCHQFGQYSAAQFYVTWAAGQMWYRRYTSGEWQEWINLSDTDIPESYFNNQAVLPNGTDVNNVFVNGTYLLNSAYTYTNLPDGMTTGSLLVIKNGETAGVQIVIGWSAANVLYRRKTNGGSWSSWALVAPGYSSAPVLYVYGDSVTGGYMWLPDPADPTGKIIQRCGFANRPTTRIAHAIGSNHYFDKSVSGIRYVAQAGDDPDRDVIFDVIQDTDMSDADVIVLAGGRNDTATELGSVAESTSGDGTICGAWIEILDYLAEEYPLAQVIAVQVTPQTDDNSTIWTRTGAGGWNLYNYENTLGALCNKYGVPFIGLHDCTYISHWADFTGNGGNYAHPDREGCYRALSNYLAGKVSAIYTG